MGRPARLAVVLASNLVLVAGLVAVGISARSVAVLAEGVDYLADAAAIGVTLLALRLSACGAGGHGQGRYPRAAVVAALVNGGWLLLVSLLVAAEAVLRLSSEVPEVHGLPVLIVSGVAAVVMLAGALLLGGDSDDDEGVAGGGLAMRAVLLDTAADAAAAAGVAVTGAVILVTGGLYWLDPAAALAISAVVAYHAGRLLVDVVAQLRAGTPTTDPANPPEPTDHDHVW